MKIILEDLYVKGHYCKSFESDFVNVKNLEDLPLDFLAVEIERRIKRHLKDTLGKV